MDDKATVRAWLYELLAKLERCDKAVGSMAVCQDEVTLKVKFK